MEKLIQYCTNASLYDGEFGGSFGWPAAGMGYIIVSENGKLIVIDGGYGDDAENILSLLSENSNAESPHETPLGVLSISAVWNVPILLNSFSLR